MTALRSSPAASVGFGLAALVAWDAAGLDLPLARLAGDAGGFALRDHWLLTRLLHEAARGLGWLLVLALVLAVAWPFGPLRRLPRQRRLQLAVAPMLAALAVSALKSASPASCPWDLAAFGGVAQYASHWSLAPDGGPGHCFPAGHASTGFAFATGWFAWRDSAPALAAAWLAAAVAAGALLGIAQQLRGAHFTSHTLWTAWVCWTVGWLVDVALRRTPTASRP